MSYPASLSSHLIVRPGAAQTRVLKEGGNIILEVALPWLAGPRQEILTTCGPVREKEGFFLANTGQNLAGVAMAPAGLDPHDAAKALYAGMLAQLDGLELYRVWN